MDELNTNIGRAQEIDRAASLAQKPKALNNRLTLVTTYNRTTPNIKEVLIKHWNLLQIDPRLATVFSEQPMIAFRRNKNLGDFLGSKRLKDSKVVRHKKSQIIERCKPCTENKSKKCCRQLNDTTTFKSSVTGREFNIYHACSCQSKNIIYLMECTKCNLQYVGKTQTSLEKRINGHRSDVNCKVEPIGADKHFRLPEHNFTRDAKFTIIEQARNVRDKNEMTTFLLKLEDNWILRLKTLADNGLNDQLNFPANSTGLLSI